MQRCIPGEAHCNPGGQGGGEGSQPSSEWCRCHVRCPWSWLEYGQPLRRILQWQLGRCQGRLSGKNLLKIEQIYIKGKKVTDYAVRTDTALAFGIPDKIGPGVYRLDLVLVDGTEITWPVPFSITAPFTETTIWEGSETISGWNGVTLGSEDAFINAGIQEGDVVRIYYTAPDDGTWWDIQLVDGHWSNLSLAELDGGNEIKSDNFPGGSQSFSFNVTPEVLAQLTGLQGWGGAMIINGEGGVTITRISLLACSYYRKQ